jgi:hypothetical protein
MTMMMGVTVALVVMTVAQQGKPFQAKEHQQTKQEPDTDLMNIAAMLERFRQQMQCARGEQQPG